MKNGIFVILVSLILVAACKMEPKQAKIQYPAIWQEKEIPEFENGIIAKDSYVDGDYKQEYMIGIQTQETFETIYNWHLTEFANKGWKAVKNLRKNIGNEDEVIILVHTKGSIKHSITVLKGLSEVQEVKTVLSFFGE